MLIYLLWYIRRIRQQTVQSNALTFAYGSSACGCSDDLSTLLPCLKSRKPYSDVQVISAIFYLFAYDSRLAGQFWEICNLSLCVMRNKYQQDGVGLGPFHELVGLEFKWIDFTNTKD